MWNGFPGYELIPQLFAGALAFLATYLLMPWVMAIARDFRLLDYPDHNRRVHLEPIPRLGGVAIFAGTIIATSVVYWWNALDPSFELSRAPILPGLLLGAGIVFVTGIVDDLRGLNPVLKLLAQTLAALCVVAYGFRVEEITAAGNGSFDLGFLSTPITILWIVGITNAFNLIDGVDGLAGTFALIGLTACIGVGLLLQENVSLVITIAMLGSVFAFLRYNVAPAKIFLGDSGSMLLGYFLSIRLLMSATTDDGVTYALVPLFALAYPLADTFIAIARRWIRGHPISRADGRHIHHQILALGLSPRRTVELLGMFFLCVAAVGISIAFAPPRVTVSLAVSGTVVLFAAFFYGLRWLKYHEFLEFGSSIASVVLNARSHVRNKVLAGEFAVRMRQAKSLDDLRQMLRDCADDLGLIEISLDTAVSHYDAPEARQISPLEERPYRVECPIAWRTPTGHIQEAVLRFWCERPSAYHHPGVDRLASRLAPAVEQWLRTNTPAQPIPAIRRSNPGFRPDLSGAQAEPMKQ